MRVTPLLGFVSAIAACDGRHAPSASTAPARVVWRYEVEVAPDGHELVVDASFVAAEIPALRVDDDAMRFVRDLRTNDGHVRYRFALGEAAHVLHDPDGAIAFGDAFLAPPSSWLLHPPDATPSSYRIHFRGGAALAAIPRASGPTDAYETRDAGLDDAPYFGFGNWRRTTSKVGDGELTIGVAASMHTITDGDLASVITDAASVLARYLHGSVRPNALILVAPGSGTGIDGQTMGGGGASILFRIGAEVTSVTARSSWVVTHELVHLNLPSFGFPHKWLEEGLATYIEPIARARAGNLATEQVWSDLVEGAPKGMPMAGDEGLERTHTWGRTYWGGALFCLAVDVAIRTRTKNARSLDDVLRAIVATGANVAQRWDVERFLALADRVTGTTVVRDELARVALAPGRVDLDAMWRDLGVTIVNGRAVFDDAAPLASVRRAITSP